MIFHLICVTIITNIIVETNAIPTSVMNPEFIRLNNYDSSGTELTSNRDTALDEFYNAAKRIREAVDDTMRQIRRRTQKLIDSGGHALKNVVGNTNENIQDTIEPLTDALKANLRAVRKLGQLAMNTVGSMPAFGIKTINKYFDSSNELVESFEQ